MAPVEYSEEWNASCGLRPQSVRNDTEVAEAYFIFNWIVLIFVFVSFPLCLLAFWMNRHMSYLAKRNFFSLVLAAFGCFCICVVGPVRDLVGRQSFPCAATLWFRIFGVVNAILPILLRLIYFREERAWAKAMKYISFRKLQNLVAVAVEEEESPASPSTIMDGENASASPEPSVPGQHRTGGGFSLNASTPTAVFAMDNTSASAGASEADAASVHSSHYRKDAGGSSTAGTGVLDSDAIARLMRKKSIRNRALMLVIPVSPILIAGLVYQFAVPYYQMNGCVGCYEETVFYLIIGATLSLLILNVLYVAYVLRTSPDPLGLLYELKWLVITAGFIGGIGFVLSAIDEHIGRPYDRGVVSWDWFIIFALIDEFFWLCPLPVINAFKLRRQIETSMQQEGGVLHFDFRSVLQHPKAQRLLLEHLANEFAVENLKFWNQVETFRAYSAQFRSIKQANIAALRTFETFVRPGAVLEVNISARNRDRLVAEFNPYTQNPELVSTRPIASTIFDEAQEEVFTLMERDSFFRFQNTTAFREFARSNMVLDSAKRMMVIVSSPPGGSA